MPNDDPMHDERRAEVPAAPQVEPADLVIDWPELRVPTRDDEKGGAA